MLKKSVLSLMTVIFLAISALTQTPKWFKGNIHVHTKKSDGNSWPTIVVKWYTDHQYDFLVITDHNIVTDMADSLGVAGNNKIPFLLKGEEITGRFGNKPVHVNAIGIKKTILPKGGSSVTELLDSNILAVKNQKGLAILNHPNGVLSRSITAQEMLSSKYLRLFEVCCSDFRGGSGKPSTDELWDSVLTTGKILYGIAADDAHDFEPASRQPGSAWIMLQADTISESSIINALDKGNFYATNGPELNAISFLNGKVSVQISNKEGWGFKTFFIGNNGRILKIDQTNTPYYQWVGDEGYIRARVERSDGTYAWIQPVFINRINDANIK